MALYTPKFVVPDMRSGIGLGVVDASQGMKVSWKITGPSALQSFSITIYTNDSASTELYTTGRITTGCPAYGTTSAGESTVFSYTISAGDLSLANITNGNEYKLIIQQWWSADDSITQNSASVFITRKAPVLTISAIGSGGVISTIDYTFTGNYTQAQGDTLNWFRWKIAYADNTTNPFFDSGYITGTMQIQCSYDGFLNGNYAILLSVQTENGVESDTGWVNFSASYTTIAASGVVTAQCANGTDAVEVAWEGIGGALGEKRGNVQWYGEVGVDFEKTQLSIQESSAGNDGVTWSGLSVYYSPTWSIIWHGRLYGDKDATIFRIKHNPQGGISRRTELRYTASDSTFTLDRYGSPVITVQNEHLDLNNVGIVLTNDTIYISSSEGYIPFEQNISYTQDRIDEFWVGASQFIDYFEIISGTATDSTIQKVMYNLYQPELDEDDYAYLNFDKENHNNLYASTSIIRGQTVSGYSLFRRNGSETVLTKIADLEAANGQLYDYSIPSNTGEYSYYLFPVGNTTYITAPIISDSIQPCWWNYTLMECAPTSDKKTFTVVAAYRFKYNIESGAVNNNNKPNILQNFTPYPTVQLVPQNYKSGSLSGLLGTIRYQNGKLDYSDTLATRDALFALSKTQNALFLKTRKGDLIRVRISEPPSVSINDATAEQTQTITIQWVEVGSAENVSLYASTNPEKVGV